MRRPTDLLVVEAPPLEAVVIVPKGLGLGTRGQRGLMAMWAESDRS